MGVDADLSRSLVHGGPGVWLKGTALRSGGVVREDGESEWKERGRMGERGREGGMVREIEGGRDG